MTFVQTILLPLRPVVGTLLSPSSICSIYSLGFAHPSGLRVGSLATEKSWPTDRVRDAHARAIFARRILLHRSTFADLAYCIIGLTTFGAILGWAVVSTSWISDAVAALLTRGFGPCATLARSRLDA